MQWIILIGDEQFDLNTLKKVQYDGCSSCYEVRSIENRYCVDFVNDHIFYDYVTDTKEFEMIKNDIPYKKPHFVIMSYTSADRVKRVLSSKTFPEDVYIDNDYGIITSLKNFIQMGMPLNEKYPNVDVQQSGLKN